VEWVQHRLHWPTFQECWLDRPLPLGRVGSGSLLGLAYVVDSGMVGMGRGSLLCSSLNYQSHAPTFLECFGMHSLTLVSNHNGACLEAFNVIGEVRR